MWIHRRFVHIFIHILFYMTIGAGKKKQINLRFFSLFICTKKFRALFYVSNAYFDGSFFFFRIFTTPLSIRFPITFLTRSSCNYQEDVCFFFNDFFSLAFRSNSFLLNQNVQRILSGTYVHTYNISI